MKKYIFIAMLIAMPLQAFADRFWVASMSNVQNDIKVIEGEGGRIIGITPAPVSDDFITYIIQYQSGADIKAFFQVRKK
jgi:hypothetical protein